MNKTDGGYRSFTLVEMEDYAEDITAERVKRVIRGYGEGDKAVEGTGGSFSFYELGAPLLLANGNINEDVGVGRIRDYVWYMETKQPLAHDASANAYRLGKHNDAAYYFYYERERATTLDHDFLSSIEEQAGSYVIYADRCTLTDDELRKFGVIFKKIPRDIPKL